MKRRKHKRKTTSKKKPLQPMTSRRSMDKMMSDLQKLLAEQEFESIDEANAFLAENVMGKEVPSFEPQTPLEEAQELLYEAWETRSKKQRIRLAKKALSISEDCVDAYVLLAEEEAKTVQAAHLHYSTGVMAGERILADEFDDMVGHFWGIVETRPYMRARAGLASTFWLQGEYAIAISHYKQLLALNPNDNQGIRYILLSCLLSHGTNKEVEELLESYADEGSAVWCYNWALFIFRKEGDSSSAQSKLQEALQMNTHVPDFLLKRRRLPRRLPDYVGFGDETEAVAYASENISLWQAEAGALSWLESALD